MVDIIFGEHKISNVTNSTFIPLLLFLLETYLSFTNRHILPKKYLPIQNIQTSLPAETKIKFLER